MVTRVLREHSGHIFKGRLSSETLMLAGGRAMSETVIHTPLAANTWFEPGPILFDLWWTKQHWRMFFSESFIPPLSVSFHQCSTRVFIYVFLLSEGRTGEAWEPGNKQMLFRKTGISGQKSTTILFFRLADYTFFSFSVFCNWSPVGRKRCDSCIEVRSGRPFMTSHSRSR